MMRLVLSTPLVVDRLGHEMRPYNFVLCPLIDGVVGYPRDLDGTNCTIIASFSKDRDSWLDLECVNVRDGRRFRLALTQDVRGSKIIPQTYGYVLHHYPYHPESKSLGPDGLPCHQRTRGLLQRASVVAGERHFVGKETDRRWEYGEDLSLKHFKATEYRPARKVMTADATVKRAIESVGMRGTMRLTGMSQHTLEAIRDGRRVRTTTIQGVKRLLGIG